MTPESICRIKVFSPDPFSPLTPNFASTPNTDSVVPAVPLILRENVVSFTSLDALALDKIFSFLGDDDLRAFHQVSRVCKAAVDNRPLVNTRRLELVHRIREKKENIANKLTENKLINEVSRVNRAGVKPGTRVLVDCKNLLLDSRHKTPTADNLSDKSDKFLTPNSRFPFQSFDEAEKSLLSGQKLIPCVKCRGPVPSPSTPVYKGTRKKTTATRCRLISRMGDDISSPVKPEVTTEQELIVVTLKKSRSQTPLPPLVSEISSSSLPLSPFSPAADLSLTTQALGERMSAVLVISDSTTTSTPVSTNQLIYCNTRNALSSDGISELYSSGQANKFTCHFSFSRQSFGKPFSPQSCINNSFRNIPESPLSAITNTNTPLKRCMYRNVIFSPEQRSLISSIMSVSSVSLQEDFLEINTLNPTTNDLSLLDNSVRVQSPEEPNNFEFILPSTDTISQGVNINRSFSSVDEGFYCQSGVPETFQSLNSLPSKPLQSKSSSDYFSGTSSVLRDVGVDLSKNFPEISSGRLGLGFISSPSPSEGIRKPKSRSRSFGFVLDEDDLNSSQLSESSVSCPNLNESYVLECPNPDCSFRFCSICLTGEHSGRPCRIIDSESFESYSENSASYRRSLSNSFKKDGKTQGKGKGKVKGTKEKVSKKSLRRIAKL